MYRIERWIQQDVCHWHQRESPRRIPPWNRIPGERRRNPRDGRVGLRERHAAAQARLDEQRVIAALIEHGRADQLFNHRRRRVERRREALVAALERGWRDADDGIRASADPHLAADGIAAASKRRPPVSKPEHHHRVSAAVDIVLGKQRPAEDGVHAQHLKVVAGHDLGEQRADAVLAIYLCRDDLT